MKIYILNNFENLKTCENNFNTKLHNFNEDNSLDLV
jgi:hypothetical protein